MMRRTQSRAGLPAWALAVGFATLLQAGAAAGDLTIVTHTSSDIVGSLDPGSLASFEAHRTSAVEATVEVTVGALTLTAVADLVAGQLDSVDLDGAGDSLTVADKTNLSALSNELEEYLEVATASLDIQEDLLLRTIAYWAEAPVGFAIGSMTVTP
jgi:hypothetical protein